MVGSGNGFTIVHNPYKRDIKEKQCSSNVHQTSLLPLSFLYLLLLSFSPSLPPPFLSPLSISLSLTLLVFCSKAKTALPYNSWILVDTANTQTARTCTCMYVCICEHCIVQYESEHTKSMSKHTQHTSSSYIIICKNIHVLYAHR